VGHRCGHGDFILAFLYPDRCGVWNRPAREGLRRLGATGLDWGKGRLSKEEYRHFHSLLRELSGELGKALGKGMDLLGVDMFLYVVVEKAPALPSPAPEGAWDHDEVCHLLLEVGERLGFEVGREVRIGEGAVVDGVWEARLGNLGSVAYVFEVQRGGSLDSLILNLQRASALPGVRKVVAVSDGDPLRRIGKGCEGLPEAFRKALGLWEVGEVYRVAEGLREAISSLKKVGLLEGGGIL